MAEDRQARWRFPRAGGAADVGSREPPAISLSDPGRLLESAKAAWLADRAAAAASELAVTGEVRVRLVTDAEMSLAHERFAGVPGTTDVLTFDLRTADEAADAPNALDVDIYACVDEARRQALALGHDTPRELLLYIIHGILHCVGYDDHDDDACARMHREEDRVLEAIGVGATFGAAEAAPSTPHPRGR